MLVWNEWEGGVGDKTIRGDHRRVHEERRGEGERDSLDSQSIQRHQRQVQLTIDSNRFSPK